MTSFSERLKEERKRIGLNQAEFGAIGGVKRNAQMNYESGDRVPDSNYLSAIAAAGADVHYMLTGKRCYVIDENNNPCDLRPDQLALLDNFEHLSKEDQEAIRRLVFTVAGATEQKEAEYQVNKIAHGEK